jgi:hypothetical protein
VDRGPPAPTFFRSDPTIRRGDEGNLRKSLALNRTRVALESRS